MEPLTLATGFATVVSLIGQFVSEQRSKTNHELRAFLEFLTSKGHDEIRQLLEANQATTIGIKALLSQSNEQLMEKLEQLDQGMASLSAGIENLSDVAAAIHPESVLSVQALGLLRQLEDRGANKIHVLSGDPGSPQLLATGADKGNLNYSEPRFIHGDLETLVKLELLREDVSAKGRPILWVTRKASQVVKLAEEKELK